MSTGERRRKINGREYDTPLPIPCTPKELDVLLDKWIVDKVFKPNQVSSQYHAFVVYTTTYNILPQNVGRSTDWCTVGSKKVL